MKTRNRTPAERAIIYAALMGGLDLEETRELLQSVNLGPLPDTSWEMLQRKYLPALQADHRVLGQSIHNPNALGDL